MPFRWAVFLRASGDLIRAFDPTRRWLDFLVSAGFVLVLLFTWLAPMASEGLGLIARFVFWVLHVSIPLAFAQAVQLLLARASSLQAWPAILVSGLIAALLFTPLASLFDTLFPVSGDDAKQAFPSLPAALLDEFFALAPPVVLCWAALNGVRGIRLSAAARGRDHPESAVVGLLRHDLRGQDPVQIVALSAELHYTRVYTTRGDDLILYAFGQATKEAGEGIQIHRSHWVATAHVRDLHKSASGWEVELDTGLRLPVARARRKEVEYAL